MKPLLAVTIGFASLGSALAADPVALHFPDERIGVPPLSLSASIASGAAATKPLQSGTGLPRYSANERSTPRSPHLVPRAMPNVLQREAPRSQRTPRVSRALGMPILEPGDAVDYKMRIIPPDENVDFKILIKDPIPEPTPEKVK